MRTQSNKKGTHTKKSERFHTRQTLKKLAKKESIVLRTKVRKNQRNAKDTGFDGMSNEDLWHGEDEDNRVLDEYLEYERKKYQEAANQYRIDYISQHGQESFREMIDWYIRGYYDIIVDIEIEGKRCRVDLMRYL